MSKKILSLLPALIVLCFLSFQPTFIAQAQETPTPTPSNEQNNDSAELDQKRKKIEELQSKLKELESQKVSLSTTIQYINTKISLSQAEIDKTQTELKKLEREVSDLGTRIGGLEQSLDVLSGVLLNRVSDQYKQQRTHTAETLLVSQGLTRYYSTAKYIKISQEKTRNVMQQAENQKNVFDEQKKVKEDKQIEVEKKKDLLASQQKQLASERGEQQRLLNDTQNNEAKYQAELQKTLAEVQAIQGIIAGRGSETKVREVKQGDQIASIIQGSSPCSNGTHLHFEVVKNGTHQNPANYLSGISAVWNNSDDGPFGFGGDWQWPLNNPAKINQGFGMTYFARVRRAYGGSPHTGIDMASKSSGDLAVKAVKDGELYRGGIGCGGRTLQYVRVIHKDDNSLSTYYLHVNY